MDKHEAVECPAGVDPLVWRRRKYTCGLRNMALGGMVLVSLLFIILAAVLLPRCSPAPAPVSAPAPAPAAEGETMLQSVSVVWTVSLLVCSYFCFWIYTFSHTMGAAAIFFRVSYGVMLAYTAAGLVGPLAGMAAAHLSTAWASGLLGYALAEYRMRTGSERAADEAAARTPLSQSEDQTLALVYCVFVSSIMTLFMAPRVVWLVFFPSYSEERAHFIVFELSCLIWMILYFWAILIIRLLLHEALVSLDFMVRVFCYYLALSFPSVLCVLVSHLLWIYYFGLEMMAMVAFFGYILAINARRNEILARDQPFLKDLEQGDVQESASASTRDDASLDLTTPSCHLPFSRMPWSAQPSMQLESSLIIASYRTSYMISNR